MSKPINDGGPAFPVSVGMGPLSANFASPGMSLRDWFAGMATDEDVAAFLRVRPDITRRQARYFHADSMIAERNKTK